MRRSIAVAIRLAILGAGLLVAQPAVASGDDLTGLKKDVTFTGYTPLSGNAEIIRRMLSPLAAAQIPDALARGGERLSDQPVNLPDERFILYVPSHEPFEGYGLLVFVPPWNEAIIPSDWVPVLDRLGLVFVSAARSGNDASVFGRRYPLALLAEFNVARAYRINLQRTYIAGFSGGSRVALRLALAYPDVFRGAILNASSDPIGDSKAPLPPKDLFFRFQESMHLVYVTGGRDTQPTINDRASMRSLRNWCVSNIDSYVEPFMAHDAMSGTALTRALEFLSAPAPLNQEKLSKCRAAIQKEVDAQLEETDLLISAGKRDDARGKLLDLDERFGGLAAPRSVELFQRLGQT